MNEIVKISNLSKVYHTSGEKVHALKGINLSIEQGEFVAITGTSGSGKSTLLHILAGIDTPSEGEVYIKNENLFEMSEDLRTEFRRKNIGLIYQFFNLLPFLNVEENISLPLMLGGSVRGKLVKGMIDGLGLEHRKNHLPSQLSGGQQQRVAIGRALITEPAILLADEPTGNLDKRNSNEIINLLKRVNEKNGQTIILVTHDEDIAKECTRQIIIEDGKVVE